MGLVMLGTGSEKALDEMLQYAHETQHEKIIRGLAMGMAFLMYGKEEEADGLVEKLLGDAVRFRLLRFSHVPASKESLR
jgi:26S proteasome regulatory subunit N2